MENDWASEHLQTIRTLMERSAVYRRALAPIMVWNGIVGVAGGLVGWKWHLNSPGSFIEFWSGAALLAIIGSFLLVRRQALKDSEPFWSPPTRRIAQALFPPLFIGGFFNVIVVCFLPGAGDSVGPVTTFLIILWLWLYGCAAQAAGFFMTRGMKFFGWPFIVLGCALLTVIVLHKWFWLDKWPMDFASSYLCMGATFGVLHLAYGIYLYLTEKGKNAA
jgi:hypothetical protein